MLPPVLKNVASSIEESDNYIWTMFHFMTRSVMNYRTGKTMKYLMKLMMMDKNVYPQDG